ncbi:Transcriptional regulatory protein TcrA [Lactobacillus helveticus]|nr:Transcriptional regulatory protein TcrA [Lactobacillus helveticus]NRO31782.1 Transcriptional regulatory protein TcrA [Lactobacillus helveticus]
MTKPFSLKELLTRLRSKERRQDDFTPNEVSIGDVILNEGKELSTEELLSHVWKNDEDANSDVVWIYVSYLRQKLQSIQSTITIDGIKGGNYQLVK